MNQKLDFAVSAGIFFFLYVIAEFIARQLEDKYYKEKQTESEGKNCSSIYLNEGSLNYDKTSHDQFFGP